MYKLLKKLGLRDDKRSAPSEKFTAEDFKKHFEKVSAERYEQTREATEEVISWIPDRSKEPAVEKAGETLNIEITVEEILKK